MDFKGVKSVEFFVSLGYVTIVASVITMLFTQLVKAILKRKKIIYMGMDITRKDMLLSKVGRMTALVTYSMFYLGNEYYLKRAIVFDATLFTGLLSGSALTLTIAKGLYTTIRQYQKKSNVFDRLKFAEETIQKLSKISQVNESIKEEAKQVISDVQEQTSLKIWKLTNKDD